MGQKASVLSHNERHTQRGGSFHLSNQASRRREAFKAAKKSHFSFGDEPYRHSVHQKSSTGLQGSRRQKPPVITCITDDGRALSPSKTISTPEKEFNSSICSFGNIRQGITSQRSLNMDYSTHLILPEGAPDFALTSSSTRPQSPADSINRSLYGTSCSHHSSVKLSEEEDGYSDRSTHTHRAQIIKEFGRTSNDSTLSSLSRVREKTSPAQSPLGYKTNAEISFTKSHVKLTKTPSPLLSKPMHSKQHTIDSNTKLIKSNISEDSKPSFKKESIESSQITAPPIPIKKRQSIKNIKDINKSTDLNPENLVAALLPPSPLSQRQKRIPSSPHNLSPYNLSPRSLSPSQCSLKSNASGQSNPYISKDVDNRKDNQIYTEFQNNQVFISKPKGSPTPGIVINSFSFKNSIDYGEPNDFYNNEFEQTVKNPNNLSVKSFEKSFNVENEFHIFCGGDLLSINSKSDTSLSSVPFHKTPSIGLSPTAERGIPNIFFIPDTKNTSMSPKNEIMSKTKDINEGVEKSSSMDGFISKSPHLVVEEKKKYQFKREREQEPITKPQRLQLTRAPSLLTQLVYPRSVPDELNSYSFLDFQGHQLLSWMCHWCAPHLKTGHKSDLYLLGCQMCTCLIACQQLVISKRSRSFQEGYSTMNIFQPEQIYHWNMIQRDALRDENDIGDKRSNYFKKQSKNCSRCQSMFDELHKRELNHSYEIQRLKQEQELEIFKVKNEGVMKVCQLNDKVEQLERQVEKYRILAGIEGLARQMWHEEAVTANSNLVMSKSPTLQSIGANKPFGGMKSCSTDTNDLEEALRKEDLNIFDSPEVPLNQSLNILKTNNTFSSFSSNSLALFTVPQPELKLQTSELKEDAIYQINVTEPQITKTEDPIKGNPNNNSKLQRFPSIAESPTIDLINDKISFAINEFPMIKSLDCLIKTRAITAEAVKRWLDLQVPIEMIDLNLLQTIQDMIQSHSEITKAINFNLDSAISNNEMSFWKELNQVFQLEEKIQFIQHYKNHIDSIQSLDIKLNQFSFVTHLLQYSESLKTILAIILEACNIKGSDHYDLSLPLEGLLQLRSMTSQCDGGNILDSVVDKYIQISIQLSTCGNLNFPLPEPNDLALLTTADMGLECLLKDLEKLEEGVKAMNDIARCILSCSRQSFTATDITIYSSRLIEVIKRAQLEVVSVKENVNQCEKQYSTLQRIFSTNLESIHFFNHWLEFAQDFKVLWIKKVLNFHRSLKESSGKQLNSNKPVGTVIPRPHTSQVTDIHGPFTTNQTFNTKSTQNS